MCRNIRSLFNYDPPSTEEDVDAAALQFVRKISGFHEPSDLNKQAFETAVKAVSRDIHQLLNSLETKAPPRSRAREIEKARERNKERFGIKAV